MDSLSLDEQIQIVRQEMQQRHLAHVKNCRKASTSCTWCSRYFSECVEKHRQLYMARYNRDLEAMTSKN